MKLSARIVPLIVLSLYICTITVYLLFHCVPLITQKTNCFDMTKFIFLQLLVKNRKYLNAFCFDLSHERSKTYIVTILLLYTNTFCMNMKNVKGNIISENVLFVTMCQLNLGYPIDPPMSSLGLTISATFQREV